MSTAPHVATSGTPVLHEVADAVYGYVQPDGSWWINNTGLLVGRHGAVSVDACATEARTVAYLEAIRKVTDRPVRTLVNTHHHGDHTHGNYLFRDATIVAHEKTRDALLEAGLWRNPPFWTPFELGDVELEPPSMTYADELTLWVDDTRCEVRHVGTPAHTTNDSVVWLPEQSVLFAGDLLFSGGTPFLLMGSVAGAVQVLEEVLAPLGARTIVPGHGEISGPGLVDEVLGYLRFVQDLAARAHADGVAPLEAARSTDLGQYAGWMDVERIVGNLHRALYELAGAERGAPIDLAAALGDMVAYNGGRPLTCLA
ncbi:MAG: Zn-dependent hydrolase, glyoxylase [Frankiales bacterium]|nr:Zn-dependent hydrolase, glyoxylase [Frankiales bacterium]